MTQAQRKKIYTEVFRRSAKNNFCPFVCVECKNEALGEDYKGFDDHELREFINKNLPELGLIVDEFSVGWSVWDSVIKDRKNAATMVKEIRQTILCFCIAMCE